MPHLCIIILLCRLSLPGFGNEQLEDNPISPPDQLIAHQDQYKNSVRGSIEDPSLLISEHPLDFVRRCELIRSSLDYFNSARFDKRHDKTVNLVENRTKAMDRAKLCVPHLRTMAAGAKGVEQILLNGLANRLETFKPLDPPDDYIFKSGSDPGGFYTNDKRPRYRWGDGYQAILNDDGIDFLSDDESGVQQVQVSLNEELARFKMRWLLRSETDAKVELDAKTKEPEDSIEVLGARLISIDTGRFKTMAETLSKAEWDLITSKVLAAANNNTYKDKNKVERDLKTKNAEIDVLSFQPSFGVMLKQKVRSRFDDSQLIDQKLLNQNRRLDNSLKNTQEK